MKPLIRKRYICRSVGSRHSCSRLSALRAAVRTALLLALLLAPPATAQSLIRGVSLSEERGATRLVIRGDLRSPKIGYLANPERVYLDFPETQWAALATSPAGTLVSGVRHGRNGTTARLVLDLRRSARLHEIEAGTKVLVFELRPAGGPARPARAEAARSEAAAVPAPPEAPGAGEPIRPAVTPSRRSAEDHAGTPAPTAEAERHVPPPPGSLVYEAPVAAAAEPAEPPPAPRKAERAKVPPRKVAAAPPPPPAAAPPPVADMAGRRVVAIDAGHGGADGGAKGARGTLEKNVTLAVARELRRQLEATGRYRAVLTRDGDQSLRLAERVAKAEGAGAELLISIHADALAAREVAGASVYTLADSASDPETEALARRENNVDPAAELAEESPEVGRILYDLAQRETGGRSAELAAAAVRELAREVTMVSGQPHRQASFAVLRAHEMPSILIELGFLSNSHDESSLKRAEYRTAIAAALVRAVDRFTGSTKVPRS